MLSEELKSVLEDPNIFHYQHLWLKEDNAEQRDVLELFAFGSFNDLNSHSQLASRLTELMLMKLRKQTIISLSESYREVSYDMIRKSCQMNDSHDIEVMLIQLRDILQIRLDSVKETVTFTQCHNCRDVYTHERDLRVVNEGNIVTKDKLLKNLNSWKRKLLDDILSV
ncbi:hypothetical protein HG535_0F04230 [Zygotorulaspora mrakii]|uniref:PCI domain-containing protein n=1 Tax=Zygotorulaspora mrakii TaxID=42260 RepID=A0A7H9B5D3_ZYGMR|nr:uncharacterized protein HG535_0F04230 [Zygotorulaspora mrakii]QLG73911.1 hypothetical protein HG535_0F04230 [Zygotorulaspora mrakii]